MNVVVVLCEGVQDIAFLYKLLKAGNFKNYSPLIKEFPSPLDQFFTGRLKEIKYEELNLENALRPTFLPTAMERDGAMVLMHALGGDARLGDARALLRDYLDLSDDANDNDDELGFGGGNRFSFAFIYDADRMGTDQRIAGIKRNFAEMLENIDHLGHNKIVRCGPVWVGCYIFSNEQGSGKLEDIVLPLMKTGNRDIFDDAGGYLDSHFDRDRLKRKKNYDRSKAIIGISGQLQYSGIGNYGIIKQTDYITDAKINNCEKCREIINFFDRLAGKNRGQDT